MTASHQIEIRPAVARDVELIHSLIRALAAYESASEQVVGTVEQLRGWLFGSAPAAETLIAEVDGETAGFALFHGTFSTWECRPGIWLEDLFVLPQYRRVGVGEKLLSEVAKVALNRGLSRVGWAALDWNQLALGFYERLGARVLDEWKLHRLSGPALEALAGRA